MGFATMNGVNAARGMQNTKPNGPATFQQAYQPQAGGVGNPYQAPAAQSAMGSSYTAQGGMMGTGRGPQGGGAQQSSMYAPMHVGAVGAASNGQNTSGNANGHGVVAGQTMPSAVGPEQQMPPFDPNDPNNAALAGYMAR